MNLKNIKRNTALKFIQKQMVNKNAKTFEDLTTVTTVGILVEEDLFLAYDFTKKLCENLKIKNENLVVILHRDLKEKELEDKHLYFSEKSLGFHAKLKGEDVASFLNKNFDLVINYCSQNNIAAQLLCYQSQAKLKAGFDNEKMNFYDISVKIPENKIDTFNQEIVKYLKIIKVV